MKEPFFTIRQLLRGCYLDVFGCMANPSKGIHILNGHYTHRVHPDSSYMEYMLNELSYVANFIRIEEAVRMILTHIEPDEPLIAFTFDDGFEECYDAIAPELEKYEINAAFFVNPNFVEGDDEYIKHFTEITTLSPGKRPMRWNQIIDLSKRGFIIGAHTMDHYLTASSDIDELKHQIVDCKAIIEDKTGVSCDYFAWPYGKLEQTNKQAVEIACDNYKYVFSQSDYRNYFSFEGKVINRRHFEPSWPVNHVKYFLSKQKHY